VKGIGKITAEELVRHQPYLSLEDLALRVNHRKVTGAKQLVMGTDADDCGGAIGALAEYGSLSGLS
jgi:hypothetical protein